MWLSSTLHWGGCMQCTRAMTCLVVGMGSFLHCCGRKRGQERGWSVLQNQKHGAKLSGWSPCSQAVSWHDGLKVFSPLTSWFAVCFHVLFTGDSHPEIFSDGIYDFWIVIWWEILYLNTVTVCCFIICCYNHNFHLRLLQELLFSSLLDFSDSTALWLFQVLCEILL